MKSFKQFLMENDITLARQDAAKVIDAQYDRLKQLEDDFPNFRSQLTSDRVNPNKTSATDDYNYWKDVLYQGQEGTEESEKLYDWIWGMMRQKAYPWQEELRQIKATGSDYEKELAKKLSRKDQVKPDPSEAPAGEPGGQYYKSSNASEEDQIRAMMAGYGHTEQDIQRIIDQRNKDLEKNQ